MKYGYFDDAHHEYVITDPHTPVKWINYIGTLAFGGFVDHTGGALLCKQDPSLNRITRYLALLPASEFKGETLYVRIRRGNSYQIFSPYYVPTLDQYDRYECHVGLGYTRILSEFYGIRTDVTIFVPTGAEVEVRDIRITNLGSEALEIDVIPVVEYTHFDALKQLTNADWVPQTVQSEAADGGNILVNYAFMHKQTRINYFTSNRPVSSFESDRPRFLGNHEYGTWAKPLSLFQPELSNYEARRGDNAGALLHHLGLFNPGETKRLITQLGQAANLDAALPSITYYRAENHVDEAQAELRHFWDTYLATIQVETPDASMNSMLNVHNPRQCHTTKNWSRYLSLYQTGYGERGLGYRDSSQDVMGVLAHIPDEGKELLKKLMHVQMRNGSAMHQLNPLTMVGAIGEAMEYEDRLHYYGDDHLWIVLAVAAYLKETGDFTLLDEVVPYYEKDKQNQPLESGTVFDHLKRAIQFTHDNTGAHGLPLLGYADWNDTVNLRKGAESLFNAHLYGVALLEMMELCAHLQQPTGKYQAYYDEMKARVNDCGWDGSWYIRYFDVDGTPLGSHQNSHGQIYVNGQSWAVMSGFATPERGRAAMDSVYEKLNTPNGIKLSAPGFNGFDPIVGGISTYPPGAKENGGIFLHANPWAMIAETMLGNGDRAFQYYNQINPAAKNDVIDVFECEPYVYPQNILGDEHPQFGLGRNSWLSGTASWAYQAGIKFILGIRPTYEGLLIDPCIPTRWDSFKVSRLYRGVTYIIAIHNPNHVSQGVTSLRVDGQPIQGQLIPFLPPDQVHFVEVTMG